MLKKHGLTKIVILVVLALTFSPAVIFGYSYWNDLSYEQSQNVNIGDWGIPISTAQEFYDFATKTDSVSTDLYYLIDDIDFTGFSWVYSSTNANVVFRGSLDGNGKTLSNLTLTVNSNSYNTMGIFPYVEGGSVYNITFENINLVIDQSILNSSSISSGLIFGNVNGLTSNIKDITIINAGVRGTSAIGTGGLIGNITNSTSVVNIENIKATNLKVFTTNAYSGGILGSIETSGAKIFINDIDIQGEVSAMAFAAYTGGVVGHVLGGTVFNLNRAIVNMTSQNTLETNAAYYLKYTPRYLGGIIGYNLSSSTDVVISNTFFTGGLVTEEAKRTDYVGTAIARSSGSQTIVNSYYAMVQFKASDGSITYTVDSRPKGIMLPLVSLSTLPTVTWWNSFADDFINANDYWNQDSINGKLYLIR